MATRKPKMTQAELRAFRSDWAKLRSKGLVKNDARMQRPTKHAKAQIKKYRDVLSGNADVVTVPRGEAKRMTGLARSGNKIVVPRPHISPGRTYGRARWNDRIDEITRTVEYPGGKRTQVFRTGMTESDLRKFEGPKVSYVIQVARGNGYAPYRRALLDDLSNIFTDGSWKNFENWASYVIVEYDTDGFNLLASRDGY